MKLESNVHLIKTVCGIYIPMISPYLLVGFHKKTCGNIFFFTIQYAELTVQWCQTKATVKLQMIYFCIHSISSKQLEGFSCNFGVQLNRMIYRPRLSVITDQYQYNWRLGNFIVSSYYLYYWQSPAHLSFHFLIKTPHAQRSACLEICIIYD